MNGQTAPHLSAWIGPSGAGDLYTLHEDRYRVVKLIVRKHTFAEDEDVHHIFSYANATPLQLMQGNTVQNRMNARTQLLREYKLGIALNHRHLHPIIEYDHATPALYLAAQTASLKELREERADLFEFDLNFRNHPHQYSVWHSLARQLTDVTQFLSGNALAHLNLNPYTVLYTAGGSGLFNFVVTDHGGLTPSTTLITSYQNDYYILPRNNQYALTLAQISLLYVLLDSIRFRSSQEHSFFISDQITMGTSIWDTVEKVTRSSSISTDDPWAPLWRICNDLRATVKSDDNVQCRALSLLLLTTHHNPTTERLGNMFHILCKLFGVS